MNCNDSLSGPCVSDGSDKAAAVACEWLEGRKQSGVIMIRHDPTPINCRPAIHGLFHFAWQNKFRWGGTRNPHSLFPTTTTATTITITGTTFTIPPLFPPLTSPPLPPQLHGGVWPSRCVGEVVSGARQPVPHRQPDLHDPIHEVWRCWKLLWCQ